MAGFRSFAIVPAAGVSARMGAHKLLLPLGGRTVIEQALASWLASDVDRVFVVARGDDAELLEVLRRPSIAVEIVAASVAPPDMKSSVQLGLRHIRETHAPTPRDVWLLAPADLPRLSTAAINTVLAAYDPEQATAVAPMFDGKRGHPLLMPWSYAGGVDRLGVGEGINSLVKDIAVREIPWGDDSVLRDVDTPGDYALVIGSMSGSGKN